jgi:hypothetical protein
MRKIRTAFGTVEVKNPRWMLCQCRLPTHARRSPYAYSIAIAVAATTIR